MSAPPAERLGTLVDDFRARDPTGRAAVVSAAAVDALLAAVLLLGPEYLRRLGAGPVALGLFGSALLLAVAGGPALAAATVGRVDPPPGTAGAMATVGALLWLGAPGLAAIAGIPAWFPLALGLVPMTLLPAVGFGLPPRRGPNADRSPVALALRRVGLAGALLPVAATVAWVPAFVPAFQVVLALVAAGAVVATVLVGVEGRERAPVDPPPAVRDALGAVRELPGRARPLLLGDLLLRFGGGLVVAFLVVAVTTVLRTEATVLGRHVGPAALFALALAVESVAAAACAVPARRLSGPDRLGPVPVAVAGALLGALFPIVLISARGPLVVLSVFGAFGVRFAGRAARRTMIERASDGREDALAAYRLLRGLVVVPSAFLGGLLFAASPTLAFGLASSVGLLGVRELLRFVAPDRDG